MANAAAGASRMISGRGCLQSKHTAIKIGMTFSSERICCPFVVMLFVMDKKEL
jgi:hypothetical protein